MFSKNASKMFFSLFFTILSVTFLWGCSTSDSSATTQKAEMTTKQSVPQPTVKISKEKACSKELPYHAVSVIDISINPQIRLFLDADGVVLAYENINKDAEETFADLDLVGQSFEEASVQICETAAEANLGIEDGKMEISFSQVFYNDEVGMVESVPDFVQEAAEVVQKTLEKSDVQAVVSNTSTFVLNYDENFVPEKEYVVLKDGKSEEKTYEDGNLKEVISYEETVPEEIKESTQKETYIATTEVASKENTKEVTKESIQEVTKESVQETTKSETTITAAETTAAPQTLPYYFTYADGSQGVFDVDYEEKLATICGYRNNTLYYKETHHYKNDYSVEQLIYIFVEGNHPSDVYGNVTSTFENGVEVSCHEESITTDEKGGTIKEYKTTFFQTGDVQYAYYYYNAAGVQLEWIRDFPEDKYWQKWDETGKCYYYEYIRYSDGIHNIYSSEGDWIRYYQYSQYCITGREVNTVTKEIRVFGKNDIDSPPYHEETGINAVYTVFGPYFEVQSYDVIASVDRLSDPANGSVLETTYDANHQIISNIRKYPDGTVVDEMSKLGY